MYKQKKQTEEMTAYLGSFFVFFPLVIYINIYKYHLGSAAKHVPFSSTSWEGKRYKIRVLGWGKKAL